MEQPPCDQIAKLSQLLVQYDAALAECSDPSIAESSVVISELSRDDLQVRFRRGRDCLELLEQLRRRQRSTLEAERGSTIAATQIAGSVPADDLQNSAQAIWSTVDSDALKLKSLQIGRFRLLRRIGSGGFGVVFLAEDPILQRMVALKIPRPATLSTVDLQQRFIRESQLAGRLTHPHIVPIYDAGLSAPVSYQVMAYCAGGNLANWLRTADASKLPEADAASQNDDHAGTAPRQNQLPIFVAARLVLGIAEGLHYAHEHGILHRDLKPSNILLRPKSESAAKDEHYVPGSVPLTDLCDVFQPMVADFGLARLFDDATFVSDSDGPSPNLECHQTLLAGTPQYMAPEQIDGRVSELCPATDVYGLGAILYETLTGCPVFPRGTVAELKSQVLDESPVPPTEIRSEIPADLEAICLQCLAKSAGHRYRSAQELARDLQAFLNGEPVTARPLGWYELLRNWSRRRPAVASLLFFSGALVMGLLCFSFWHVNRLNDLNGQLNTSVDELRLQTKAAMEAGLRAEKLARYAGARNYATSLIRATELFRTDQFGRSGTYLQEFLPEAVTHPDPPLRGFEWRYLWNQTRHHRELRGHTNRILAAAMSADGALCYSISKDETIRRWRAGSGQLVNKWSIGPPATDYSARISADGSRAIVARTLSDAKVTEVVAWDLSAGKPQHRHLLPGNSVLSLAIAPNGAWIAAGGKNSENMPFLGFWDFETGEHELADLPLPRDMTFDGLNEIVVSPSGMSLALCFQSAGASGSLLHHIFVAELARPSGKSVSRHTPVIASWSPVAKQNGGLKTTAEFSPDGTLLAFTAASPNHVAVWNWKDARLVGELSDLQQSIDSLVFHPNGKAVALGISYPVPVATKSSLRKLQDEGNPSGDQLIFWNLETGLTAPTMFHGLQSLHSLAFHQPSDTWIIGEGGGRLSLWRPEISPVHMELPGHAPAEAWGLAFSADSKTLYTVGDDWMLKSWEVATSGPRASGNAHKELVSCVATSRDGRWIATGGYDQKVILWDASTMQIHKVLSGHKRDLRAVAFSPDGTKLVSGGRDNQIRVWNTEGGQLLRTFTRGGEAVRGLGFSSENDLFEGSTDGHLVHWRMDGSFEVVATESEEIHSIMIAPPALHLPDAIASKPLTPEFAELTSDTKLLYGCKGGNFRGVQLGQYSRGQWFDGSQPGADIRTIDLAPDGLTIAVAGDDHAVHLWHVESGQELLAFDNLPAAVNQVRFSPDGQYLAAALHDGTIRLWHAPAGETR